MTNEEKDLLIAYLADAGELDPDSDIEPISRTGTKSAMAPSIRRCEPRMGTSCLYKPPQSRVPGSYLSPVNLQPRISHQAPRPDREGEFHPINPGRFSYQG